MTTIAFFNNKGGVGKTSLAYHLSWMFADLGLQVLAADFDPQANLTSMFLPEDRLEQLWPDDEHPDTVLGALQPLMKGTGDVSLRHVEQAAEGVHLLVGDLGLSRFEDDLSETWSGCSDGRERAFRVTSALHRLVVEGRKKAGGGVALIDVGPNLGAINRAALLTADFVVVPLAPDLFSLQGLRNLGPTLRRWREEWTQRRDKASSDWVALPQGRMEPAGYVILQHAMRLNKPVKAYERWIDRIPLTYHTAVLGEDIRAVSMPDPHRLASMKHYRSLMPLAQDAQKPVFHLRPADGAIGGHMEAVNDCRRDFERLARAIAGRCGLVVP